MNCAELHRRDLGKVRFRRSQHLPGLTGSQRVRGSNPLSSTLAVTSARSGSSQVNAAFIGLLLISL